MLTGGHKSEFNYKKMKTIVVVSHSLFCDIIKTLPGIA